MDTVSDTTPRPRQYADPFACPACSHRLPIDVERCPGCGLLLQSLLARQLLQTLRTADNQLTQLIAASRRQSPPPPAPPAAPAPRRDRPAPRGLSEVTVPKLLLGIGALCLLVAALIFLALAWSWLGIGGRTAVLVGLTVVTGSLGIALTRRDLRVAGEALTTVALGLLVLDLLGAASAGWLGDPSFSGMLGLLGVVVLAAALPIAFTTRLVAPQLAGAAALSLVGAGWLLETSHQTTTTVAVLLAYAVLVGIAHRRRLLPLVVASGTVAGLWWLRLATFGLAEAIDDLSLRGLWADGHAVPFLVASLLLLLPAWLVRDQATITGALASVVAAMLTGLAVLPAMDETTTVAGVVTLAALVGWLLVLLVTPGSWKPVPLVPLSFVALPVIVITCTLGVQAASRAVTDVVPEPAAAPILLFLGVAALLGVVNAVIREARSARVSAVVLSIAAIGTLALHAVPAWTIVAAITVLGVALVADAAHGDDAVGEALAGVAILASALVVAAPDTALLAAVLAVLTTVTAVLHWRGAQRVHGGALLPLALAGLVWTVSDLAGTEVGWRGVPVLLALGVLSIVRPRSEVEIAAGVAGLTATLAAVTAAADPSTSLAVHLTIAGALVTVSALAHPHRRELGWLGGALLAAATWVRLADLGVTAPEPYTLPTAGALLIVGLLRLQRDPETSTMTGLGAGLALATVPSLLWVLADPVSPRAAVLGAACLGLVVAGVTLRWSAPVVVGSAVGTAVVLREVMPYAAEVPQWLLIGTAGTVLTVLGITWEQRLRDLRAAASYVERLR